MSRPAPHTPGERWTDDAMAAVLARYNAGESAGLVAEAFGVTRHTIIGLLGRARSEKRYVRKGKPTKSLDSKNLAGAPAKDAQTHNPKAPNRRAIRFDKHKPVVSVSNTSPIPASYPDGAGDSGGAATVVDGQSSIGSPAVSSLGSCEPQTAPVEVADPQVADLQVADSASPGVLLEDAGSHQCRYPLWPHDARPGQAGYGLVCGARAVSGSRRRYCAHHQAIAKGQGAAADREPDTDQGEAA